MKEEIGISQTNEKLKEEEGNLNEFHQEMQDLKDFEESGQVKTVHFKGLEVKNLNVMDMKIWEKFKHNKLFLEEFKKYRSNLTNMRKDSRKFAIFLGNKLQRRVFYRNEF